MMIFSKVGALMPTLASSMSVHDIERLSSLFQTLAIIAFCVGTIALAASLYIWIKLDIKNVIGFLSGKNAAKAIEALLTGKQAYRGKGKAAAAPVPRSAVPREGYDPEATVPLQDTDRTELLDKNRGGAPSPYTGDETELLDKKAARASPVPEENRTPEPAYTSFDEDWTPEPPTTCSAEVDAESSPSGFSCEETQILTAVWDEEIKIDI